MLQYSAFEDHNVLNDMAVSFNALYKNYKTAANYACKMQYLYLLYVYLSIYLSGNNFSLFSCDRMKE